MTYLCPAHGERPAFNCDGCLLALDATRAAVAAPPAAWVQEGSPRDGEADRAARERHEKAYASLVAWRRKNGGRPFVVASQSEIAEAEFDLREARQDGDECEVRRLTDWLENVYEAPRRVIGVEEPRL